MSKIALSGNASGTGTFTIASPNSNTDRTLNLPDAGGTVVSDTATQTLTNKTINGGAITQATAVTASGTSVDFTGIPSWAKRVTVVISDLSTNGAANIRFQLGDSGGVETTGYTSVAGYAGASSAALVSTSGFDGFGDSGASGLRSGSFVFSLLSPASNTWALQGMFYGGGNFVFLITGGKTLSGTLGRVRVTTSNGTDAFDAGTINIMYEG
jgi:hypothetical protein